MTAPSPYGAGCSCPCLGVGTPEHAPGPLCLPVVAPETLDAWADAWADLQETYPGSGIYE